MISKGLDLRMDSMPDFPGICHQYYFEGYSLPAMCITRTTVQAPPFYAGKQPVAENRHMLYLGLVSLVR